MHRDSAYDCRMPVKAPPASTPIALFGARGYTGAEVISIVSRHPLFSLVLASSSELAGRRVGEHVQGFEDDSLKFADSSPDLIEQVPCDAFILALPNGESEPFVEAIEQHHPDAVIVDLSSDHRFDDDWIYGLTEHFRDRIASARRIANPGCYATAMQLAIRPVLSALDAPPAVFGVSGYSGAGSRPTERNDAETLRDNLLPYQLTGHVHAREASRHLGTPVRFHPHVAPFFRGITLTVSMTLKEGIGREDLDEMYLGAYLNEPLVKYATETPYVRDIAKQPLCRIGGLTVDAESGARHAVVVATIDNLLKGAATQAIQNANLACGFDEFAGLLPGRT